MRIKTIKIKTGQSIELGTFTVLVGPNNVGKSQTLRDINNKIVSGPSSRSTLIESLTLTKPQSFQDMFRGLLVVDHPSQIDHKLVRGITSNLQGGDEIAYHRPSFEQQFNQQPDGNFLMGGIGRFKVALLDASSRLSVAGATGAFNPHTAVPQRLLQGLFLAGKTLEDQLRDAFRKTFKMDIKLDYSGMTELYLRVASEFPTIPPDPRDAYPIMKQYNQLDSQGDGFRSFVGVVLSLLLSEGRVILLDEPEAFLHPAQARQLGYWIANYAQSGVSQIIVATHNSNFLTGILSRGTSVDIYRLNRTGDVTTYQKITADAISKLTKSPLLSSQSVLDSVFHKGVVVCEADSDRTIYQTVAVRELGNQAVLFIHAQSKQTVKDVVNLLRDATIPVAAIVDFDILNSKDELEALLLALDPTKKYITLLELRDKISATIEGQPDENILKSLETNVTEFLKQLEKKEHTLSGARSALKRIDASMSRWNEAKKHGLDVLGTLRPEAEAILKESRDVRLYIVPVGELESWIDVGTMQKKRWIILALGKLFAGDCPQTLKDFVQEVLVTLGELQQQEKK